MSDLPRHFKDDDADGDGVSDGAGEGGGAGRGVASRDDEVLELAVADAQREPVGDGLADEPSEGSPGLERWNDDPRWDGQRGRLASTL